MDLMIEELNTAYKIGINNKYSIFIAKALCQCCFSLSSIFSPYLYSFKLKKFKVINISA
jgi:hypothetical protein